MIIYKEFKPNKFLREFIKCFWVLERIYDISQPKEDVLPDSYIEFILNFNERYYQRINHQQRSLPFCFMVGLLKEPLPLYADGKVQLLCARFYPWGLLSFFNASMEKNINIDFGFALSGNLQEKFQNLLNLQSYEQAVKELESIFIEKYIRINFDRNIVSAAAQILYKEKGECKIEELAKFCHTSSRTIQRNFKKQLGISPKSYSQNVRFDKVKKILTHNPNADLTSLAYEAGYYDQAHFTKDFKNYCNLTPSEFANQMKKMQEIFIDKDNVVFLQS